MAKFMSRQDSFEAATLASPLKPQQKTQALLGANRIPRLSEADSACPDRTGTNANWMQLPEVSEEGDPSEMMELAGWFHNRDGNDGSTTE